MRKKSLKRSLSIRNEILNWGETRGKHNGRTVGGGEGVEVAEEGPDADLVAAPHPLEDLGGPGPGVQVVVLVG